MMSLIPCLVQSLGETLPLLLKKLDKLQNQSTHAANISENINHIRQLIQQARNAASKVGPPHIRPHIFRQPLTPPPCFGSSSSG